MLKCFGVDRRRTRWGWLLLFDRQLEEQDCRRLIFKYGLDQSVDQPDHPPTDIESWSVSAESCEFCRSSGNSGPLLRRTLRGIEPEAGKWMGSPVPRARCEHRERRERDVYGPALRQSGGFGKCLVIEALSPATACSRPAVA